MSNALNELYKAYLDECKPRIVNEDLERIAFVNGFMAALATVDIDPESLVSKNGNSVAEDADELVKWIEDTN